VKLSWYIDDVALPISESQVHLGVTVSTDLKNNKSIEENCKKAAKKLYAITNAGEECKTTNPLTFTSLYEKVIILSVLYGSEMWTNLSQTNIRQLETFQHKCLNSILNLRTLTRSDMCETLTGTYIISSAIDKRKLNFLLQVIGLGRCYEYRSLVFF